MENSRINLLSPNDLVQLQRAMASGREISLTRTLSDFTITASTTRAVPVWECDMLVRWSRPAAMFIAANTFAA